MVDAYRSSLSEGEQAGIRYRFAEPKQAPQGMAGARLARNAGESMEFMEHREYQPGDDLRRMNWSAYARSDRLIVKVFRQEVCPHFDLLLDVSKSMALEGTQKQRAALGIAAALASAAENSGFSKRIYQTSRGCVEVQGGNRRPAEWGGIEFSSTISPAEAVRIHPPAWRPHGIRAMVSDFLWLGNPKEILNSMTDRAAEVVLIQILAAEDANPSELGNHRFIDSETGEAMELYVDAAGRNRYLQNLNRHQQEWRAAARQMGAHFFTFIAEDLCRDWDFSELVKGEVLMMN